MGALALTDDSPARARRARLAAAVVPSSLTTLVAHDSARLRVWCASPALPWLLAIASFGRWWTAGSLVVLVRFGDGCAAPNETND